MSKLIDAVEAKLAADGVSATAAAKSAGLSLPSFRAVLKGKSTPNARGLKKYAKLLGISQIHVAVILHRSRTRLQKEVRSYQGEKS